MKTRMISAVMAAFMLAAASVGGITASAEEGTAETTETTASEPADESSDDMEKFREVMSELAEAETNDVAPDYDGDPYYDTDGNATLIKSQHRGNAVHRCDHKGRSRFLCAYKLHGRQWRGQRVFPEQS